MYVFRFRSWLNSQPHHHTVVITGNTTCELTKFTLKFLLWDCPVNPCCYINGPSLVLLKYMTGIVH